MRLIRLFLVLFLFSYANISFAENERLQNKITKNLRCLICQGQSVADSNSEFAQTIKIVVRDQINDGKSEKEIYDFLIEKYGEWIVYKPPFNSFTSILWIFPYLAFIIGGVLIFLLINKRENR